MTVAQLRVVAITVALCALDGFDVLAISFASPGIARQWGIDRAALGVVLSMELIGMGIGSILLGGVADRSGRRRTVLGCLLVMSLGMALAATAGSLLTLSLWRVLTGLGIGGMLASLNAIAPEFSNLHRRDLSVSLMAIGYPLGAIIGGSIAAGLLAQHDWRSVFEFGAIVSALMLPVVWFWVPESVVWLCRRQPAGALARLNHSLMRLGYPRVAALPPVPERSPGVGTAAIFRPEYLRTTVLATLAYALHILTFYFTLKWIPKIVVDMGFTPALAAGVLVWANVGGASGGAVVGLLTQRLGLKPLTIVWLIASTVTVAVFGHAHAQLWQLSLVCAVAGFCTNGSIIGLYAILARVYPSNARAAGTGFAIGIGRGGAVVAPIVAGILFQVGWNLQAVALTMAFGSVLAAVAVALMRIPSRQGLVSE
ncbi:MAG TPA: MFS transporter [Steroidobacteraceae bacterium]|jgi:benzoate transport